MAFVLDPAVAAHEALRSVALVECERALDHLRRHEAQDVHETRKSLKRLRAWLRVLQPQLGKRYALLNPLLRDAARALAGRRDADVARSTLLSLRRGRLLSTEQYLQLLARLPNPPGEVAQIEAANTDARRLLKAARVYLQQLQLPALADAQLAATLASSRSRCRRRWQRARAQADAETLHEWRKSVKHLATQAGLLALRLPGADADVPVLKALGETLGRHHDYDQLSQLLARSPAPSSELLQLRLRDALAQRQRNLERRALRLGRDLFDR